MLCIQYKNLIVNFDNVCAIRTMELGNNKYKVIAATNNESWYELTPEMSMVGADKITDWIVDYLRNNRNFLDLTKLNEQCKNY